MNADNIIPNVFQKLVYKTKKFQNTLYVSLLSRQEAFWTNVCEPIFEGSFSPHQISSELCGSHENHGL